MPETATPMTLDEIDSFARFATSQLGAAEPGLSIDECFLRWRFRQADQAVDLSPFPGGETLGERLVRHGILGSGSPDHPEDLSTDPRHMEGFGGRSSDEAA